MFGDSPFSSYFVALALAAVVIVLLVAVLPVLVSRRGRHRTWFQRLLLSFNIFLVVTALTTAGGLAYFYRQISEIPRFEFGEGILAEEVSSGEPRNFLLVGTDRSEGLDPDDPITVGRNAASLLSDTIMILRVEPDSERASLISFPRDLWLPIAGTGSSRKINSALSIGGPETLIRTIEENFGIPIHHYVQVDFLGFKQLVSAIGGVPMFFPDPVRDPTTGLFVNVPPDGDCVSLDPDQALAFVRSRSYETLTDGTWETDPSGDLGRISRQQVFIRQALDRSIARGVRNPFTLDQLIEVGQANVTLDDNLTTADIVELGSQFSAFDPETLETFGLPVRGGSVGGASVVFLVEDEAQDELNVFRGVDPLFAAVTGIRIGVRNGSGVAGQAAVVAEDLRARNFTVTDAFDAESFGFERTVIRYGPGEELAALFVAGFLEEEPELVQADDLGDATLVVVTGADYAGLRDEPRPIDDLEHLLPSTTSTTAPTGQADDSGGPTTTAVGDVPDQPEDGRC